MYRNNELAIEIGYKWLHIAEKQVKILKKSVGIQEKSLNKPENSLNILKIQKFKPSAQYRQTAE